jgi:hypothetical protein
MNFNNPFFIAATAVLLVVVIKRWCTKVYHSYNTERPAMGGAGAWARNRIFVAVRDSWDWTKSAATLTFLAAWSYSSPDHHIIPAFAILLGCQIYLDLVDSTQRHLTLGPYMDGWLAIFQSVTVITFGYLFWLKRLPADWSFWSDRVVLTSTDLFSLGTVLGFC